MDSSSRETASFSEGSTGKLSPFPSGSLFRLLDPATVLSISTILKRSYSRRTLPKARVPRQKHGLLLAVTSYDHLGKFDLVRPEVPFLKMPGSGNHQAGFSSVRFGEKRAPAAAGKVCYPPENSSTKSTTNSPGLNSNCCRRQTSGINSVQSSPPSSKRHSTLIHRTTSAAAMVYPCERSSPLASIAPSTYCKTP
jgi:hypothetical protein